MTHCIAPNCRCVDPCAALLRRRRESREEPPACDGWEWCDGCESCTETVVTDVREVTARKARPRQGIEPGDRVKVVSLREYRVGGPIVRRWRTYSKAGR